jgi:TctA family transporter
MITPFDRPDALVGLAAGSLIGVIIGLVPGVSARAALLIITPFLLGLPPLVAAILLVAMHAAAQVSGTVPAALFGAPTSAAEAATVINGYPLSLRGQASRVVGVILGSSAFGGVAGALVLLLVAPFMAKALLFIGTPEIAALACLGLVGIAAVSSSGLPAGIALGALGILCSTVGVDPIQGVVRLTFGVPRLIDGFGIPAVIAGIIAIPELLRHEPAAERARARPALHLTIDGLFEPFRHLALSLKSAAIGVLVGITPGIGTSVAVWMSYGMAARGTPRELPFGEGAVEGIVAPEVAAGSKEGGAFIPTLFLGVPGSSGMAIILAAFTMIGIQVGPAMMRVQPELPAAVALTIGASNLLGLAICLLFAPLLLHLARLPRRGIAVVSLCGALIATYYTAPNAATVWQMLGFGIFGLLLIRAGIARAPFLLGFIIGPVLESALQRSTILYGWETLLRPGVLILLGLTAALLLGSRLTRRRGAARATAPTGISPAAMAPLGLGATAAIVTLFVSQDYAPMSAMMPRVAAITTLGALAVLAALQLLRRLPAKPAETIEWLPAGLGLVGLAAASLVGWVALLLPLAALPLSLIRRRPRQDTKNEVST